jgi:hypothetical protein
MAVALQLGPVDAATANWLSTCPDPMQFVKAAAREMYLATKTECHECGEPALVRDLRYDQAYFETGELICRSCWTMHDAGTMAIPDYKAPPWPEQLVAEAHVPLYQGLLRQRTEPGKLGPVVGIVTYYNKKLHYGKVCLLAYGCSDAEFGSLDPDTVVTDLEVMQIGEDRVPRKCERIMANVLAQAARMLGVPLSKELSALADGAETDEDE